MKTKLKTKLKNFLSCILVVFAISFNASADQQQDPALIQSMISKYTLTSPQILANRHFWLDLALQNNLGFKEPGLLAGIGYRINYLGIDIRYNKGKSSYGEIRRLAAENTSTDPSDNAEIDLARNKSDLWSHSSVGLGFSVANQFFSGFLSAVTERVRTSIAYGNYNDDVNNIPFKSYIFNVETSILYNLKPKGPLSLCASLNWNTGTLVRDYGIAQSETYGLPVSWVGSSLGLEYAF
jgi:hypothetical protein